MSCGSLHEVKDPLNVDKTVSDNMVFAKCIELPFVKILMLAVQIMYIFCCFLINYLLLCIKRSQ